MGPVGRLCRNGFRFRGLVENLLIIYSVQEHYSGRGDNIEVSYKCVKCQPSAGECEQCAADEVLPLYDLKIAAAIENEEFLNKHIMELKLICDDLKSSYENYARQRERQLNEELEQLDVERQVYHDNVFVGNQAIIVLQNHTILTNVTADRSIVH